MTALKTGSSPGDRPPILSYRNPPVNEVVCGVRFRPMDGLLIPHYGEFWTQIRRQFPNIKHAIPIGESPGEIPLDKETGFPLPRVWYINSSDDQLVQLQKDRLYFNWRKRVNEYPRYPYVFSQFESVYCIANKLFAELGLGELEPTENELTYINHILQGEGWSSLDNIRDVFTDFLWVQRSGRFLPGPSRMNWSVEFALPDNRGNLTVNLKYATRLSDKLNLLVLELVARGKADSNSPEKMVEWFDLAHEWIVRGFAELTTAEIQKKIWGREGAGT